MKVLSSSVASRVPFLEDATRRSRSAPDRVIHRSWAEVLAVGGAAHGGSTELYKCWERQFKGMG